jgi:hypothetical protein
MDTNKMREQFEAKFPIPAGVAWKESIGMYEVVDIWKLDQAITIGKYNWLWEGWQASREAVVVELGAPSHWVADYAACGGGRTVFDAEKASKVTDPMCLKTPAYTVHALEKAGLKVAP